MDRRERVDNPIEALTAVLNGWQSGLWTALPALVTRFDADRMVLDAEPLIMNRVKAPNGTVSWVQLPLLINVPVEFMGGGGATLTFPIKPGDEAWIMFSSRNLAQWWQTGRISRQPEPRMHDLSDGIAIVGLRSLPRALNPAVSTSKAQLRSDDGNTYIELDPETSKVRIEATDIELHARHSYSWDVFGFGERVTYEGDNVWNVHKWQTPRPEDTVTATDTEINPPEGP